MADTPPEPSQPASTAELSLAEALLAPLDSILKAQVHAARSFLNLLLQIGYPHLPVSKKGDVVITKLPTEPPFALKFMHEQVVDGITDRHTISMPALALVPISPLAVDQAEFSFALSVTNVDEVQQLQSLRDDEFANKRPWFLVRNPKRIVGTLAPSGPAQEGSARIDINVKLTRVPMPSGLDKLIAALTQSGGVVNAIVPHTPTDSNAENSDG
jgi:hypothetical protein